MEHLKELEIIKLMQSYLSEDIYNYAIMLDGEWGCGKSFFVKDVLIPKLQDTRIAIYVSLFGLKNVEEISTAIFSAIIQSRLKLDNRNTCLH